jgi:long-chain acyl-CoA synthetase
MNIAWLLNNSASWHAERPAWRFGGDTATYREFTDRVQTVADGLRRAGLQPGDRVLLCLPNRPELLEMLLAAMWAGLVAVPVNWHLHPDEVAYITRQSGARAVLVASETDQVAETLSRDTALDLLVFRRRDLDSWAPLANRTDPAYVDPSDPAWLFYTSGTTGRPKGAILTHSNLWAMTLNYYSDVDRLANGSVVAHAAPLTHGSGLYLLPALGRAATNVILPSVNFDAGDFIALLGREKATHVAFLAPTMLRRLVSHPALPNTDLAALSSVVVGGAPLYRDDLALAAERLGHVITQMYGQGESPMTVAVMPAADLLSLPEATWASCGRPFVGVSVRIVDATGSTLPADRDGEVWVSGDTVMAGYWNDPAATASALHKGWLRTGDIGHFDSAGYLYLTDRAKDVIITGGSNVYPREVEEALLTHPQVREAAVIGVPDPEWGESIAAYVVPEPGANVDAPTLVNHVKGQLASFKKPRYVDIVDELPTNAAGKVLKRALRERAATVA